MTVDVAESVDTDLVKQLREYRPSDEWGPVHHMICTTAAEEIERLRADVGGYGSAFETQHEEIERLMDVVRQVRGPGSKTWNEQTEALIDGETIPA